MTRHYRPGRYSDQSGIAMNNKLDAQRFGPAKGRRNNWTQEEMDRLLEGFLVLRLAPTGKVSLYTHVGRSRKGTETQLQKFGIAYDDKEKSYHGVDRTDRTGWTVSDRDIYLIKLATAPRGRQENAHYPEYLGRILSRSTPSMKKIMKGLAFDDNCFGIKEPGRKGESSEDAQAVIIYDRLKSRLCDYERVCVRLKQDLAILGRKLGLD